MTSKITKLLLLFWLSEAMAICGLDNKSSSLGLSYASIDSFSVASGNAYEMDATATRLSWRGEYWQASHDYLALEFPQQNLDTPVTTGDLHALVLGYANENPMGEGVKLQWAVLPTLAVSSNQLKNPDELVLDSFRLDGYLVWHQNIRSHLDVFAGICSGAVTGDYSISPVLGVELKQDNWRLRLAYPATTFQVNLSGSMAIFSDWALAGNQWQILDSNLENRSEVNIDARRLRLGFRLTTAKAELAIFWMRQANWNIDYLSRNLVRLDVEAANTDGWMFQYRHFF